MGVRQGPSSRRWVVCRWTQPLDWGQQGPLVLRQALFILRSGMLLRSRISPDFSQELEALLVTLSAVCPGCLTTSRAGLQILISPPIYPVSCCPSHRLWRRGPIKALIPNGAFLPKDKFRIVLLKVGVSRLMRFQVCRKTWRKLPYIYSAAGSNRPRFFPRERLILLGGIHYGKNFVFNRSVPWFSSIPHGQG